MGRPGCGETNGRGLLLGCCCCETVGGWEESGRVVCVTWGNCGKLVLMRFCGCGGEGNELGILLYGAAGNESGICICDCDEDDGGGPGAIGCGCR